MDDFAAIIEDLIRSQVGKAAKFKVYDRLVRNPMNFVLEEAERQSSKKFIVYWVEGGIPENFSLRGEEPIPVVFNRRFVEIASFIRNIITVNVSRNIRLELSERLCLRLMAELSLSYGDSEFAILAFVKSIVGQHVHIPTTDVLLALELAPKNEAYMFTWFFGLAHEIGHTFSRETQGTFLDKPLRDALEEGLNIYPFSTYPEELKREALEKSKQPGSMLSIDQLQGEAQSDIHATSILLFATRNIMREFGEQFQFEQFIAEVIIFINIIFIFQRCKDMAKRASHLVSDRDARAETALAPLSFHVRSLMVMEYLVRAFLPPGTGIKHISQGNVDLINNLIDKVADSLKNVLNDVDAGLARAMRFALYPNEREPDLLSRFAEEVSEPESGALTKLGTKAFCELAESLGVTSETMQALRREAGLKEIDLIYILPWVKAPGQVDRPFSLDTKYGHLIFVFQTQGELYNTFFNSSAKSLPDGYQLQTAAVVVRSREQLVHELLAKSMPSDRRFGVVSEGTKEFRQMMEELIHDTIWPSE